MGVTGSGKSSFISLCLEKVVKIGHDLNACTSVVDVYAYDELPDRTIYLIDTPGFDDTSKSDPEVLSEIAAWMGDSYRSDILLNGILYLYRIADIRMQGSAKKNLLMFKELCGTDSLKTFWSQPFSGEEAVKRGKELTETPQFWGWMLSKGSSFYRHCNTRQSARDIVNHLADQNAPPVATDLQKQLVDERRTLDQTSAGHELALELLKEKEKWTKQHDQMEAMMKAAIRQRDHEMENYLRAERD
ncbi:P-loop containing nucleoside triphosphate hydrolase protein [Penicillium capsulatum]|uniref:P-loop containing nucleoside triphosphate hydrolase protein n=1 Tax=Penicillium capsulatum TaxID=69766 RepID=A0A9W9IRL0_9EURO|nr:P-loop containing nucleoside triphosphate hydrolase protein [Penicillium capsulatum]